MTQVIFKLLNDTFLIILVPVPLPHGLRTRLTAELDNCYVSLFELKTGKLVSGGLLSGSWNQMPAKIEQLMGSNLRNYHFRVLSDVLDISGPLSLSEIFSSHNFPVYSCKSLILYRHRAGEGKFCSAPFFLIHLRRFPV